MIGKTNAVVKSSTGINLVWTNPSPNVAMSNQLVINVPDTVQGWIVDTKRENGDGDNTKYCRNFISSSDTAQLVGYNGAGGFRDGRKAVTTTNSITITVTSFASQSIPLRIYTVA